MVNPSKTRSLQKQNTDVHLLNSTTQFSPLKLSSALPAQKLQSDDDDESECGSSMAYSPTELDVRYVPDYEEYLQQDSFPE